MALNGLITERKRKDDIQFMVDEIFNINIRSNVQLVSEWAEKNRTLGTGVAAYPGPFSFDRTPYLREIADCLSDSSSITEVVLMKGTQIGATTGLLENHIGYCIDNQIGSILYVGADQAMAEASMEKRIDEMIFSANLQDKIIPTVIKKSNKSTGDTKSTKSYKGGILRAVGPNSEGKLRTFPCRILYLDEVDVYPLTMKGKGNPIEKALRRADSYGPLKKVLYLSTPKDKSTSQIEPLFQQGDMRYFNVPCIKCGHLQVMKWNHLKWDKNEEGEIDLVIENDAVTNDPVYYECEKCEEHWRNSDKKWFLPKGMWIPTKDPDRPGLRSYHISGLYSPVGFRSWLDAVIQFLRVKDDLVLFADFVNDFWGETWEQRVDKPDSHYLAARAETDWQRGDINQQIKILTAGVDVQDRELIMSLIGWRDRKEAWTIEHYIFEGDTINPFDDCYNNLEETLRKKFYKTDGTEMDIQVALVDAAHHTKSVMDFCDRFKYRGKNQGCFPCFGKQTLSMIVKEHKSTIDTPELLLDDQRLKRELYTNLQRKIPPAGHAYPPGFLHFNHEYSEDFYKELTAEEITKEVNSKGFETFLISNAKQRANHVLDCHKMALAGLYFTFFKYFELENERRKKRKRKPIPPDWQYYWRLFDPAIISEDEKKD